MVIRPYRGKKVLALFEKWATFQGAMGIDNFPTDTDFFFCYLGSRTGLLNKELMEVNDILRFYNSRIIICSVDASQYVLGDHVLDIPNGMLFNLCALLKLDMLPRLRLDVGDSRLSSIKSILGAMRPLYQLSLVNKVIEKNGSIDRCFSDENGILHMLIKLNRSFRDGCSQVKFPSSVTEIVSLEFKKVIQHYLYKNAKGVGGMRQVEQLYVKVGEDYHQYTAFPLYYGPGLVRFDSKLACLLLSPLISELCDVRRVISCFSKWLVAQVSITASGFFGPNSDSQHWNPRRYELYHSWMEKVFGSSKTAFEEAQRYGTPYINTSGDIKVSVGSNIFDWWSTWFTAISVLNSLHAPEITCLTSTENLTMLREFLMTTVCDMQDFMASGIRDGWVKGFRSIHQLHGGVYELSKDGGKFIKISNTKMYRRFKYGRPDFAMIDKSTFTVEEVHDKYDLIHSNNLFHIPIGSHYYDVPTATVAMIDVSEGILRASPLSASIILKNFRVVIYNDENLKYIPDNTWGVLNKMLIASTRSIYVDIFDEDTTEPISTDCRIVDGIVMRYVSEEALAGKQLVRRADTLDIRSYDDAIVMVSELISEGD
jgi:hypothetical protein